MVRKADLGGTHYRDALDLTAALDVPEPAIPDKQIFTGPLPPMVGLAVPVEMTPTGGRPDVPKIDFDSEIRDPLVYGGVRDLG